MPGAQHPQSLPSFSLALRSDQYKTILPNLSYPSRSVAHVPWSGSSAPLLFTKTTGAETTIATSTPNVQAPTTNICFHAYLVPDTFYKIGMLIRHNLSMIVRKLKLIKESLFGVRTANPSVTASV